LIFKGKTWAIEKKQQKRKRKRDRKLKNRNKKEEERKKENLVKTRVLFRRKY